MNIARCGVLVGVETVGGDTTPTQFFICQTLVLAYYQEWRCCWRRILARIHHIMLGLRNILEIVSHFTTLICIAKYASLMCNLTYTLMLYKKSLKLLLILKPYFRHVHSKRPHKLNLEHNFVSSQKALTG